jgi:excinuclease ABC subunit C
MTAERESGTPLARLRTQVRRAPARPGVYRFRDEAGDILYVGKAKDLRKRLQTYVRGGRGAPDGRIGEMVARAREVETVVTASETEALLLEHNFIKQARPPYNLRLRDDKSYPFIEVSLNDEWPRVRFTRARHVPGNLYFGPYSSARMVRDTLDAIGRIFPYRKCRGESPGRRSGSPCLQYFIKRSLAPCDGRVTHEEYDAVIAQVVDFLRGRLTAVERSIAAAMESAAAAREFEKAALLRDRLAAVRHVQERQAARTEGAGSFDVIGLWQSDPGANLQVLRVRDGAVVDRQTFYVENASGRGAGEVVVEFLLAYYTGGVSTPAELIVPVDLGNDATAVTTLLAEARGSRVVVRRAVRGPKRRLLEMAQRNAEEAGGAEAERVAQRRESRERALASLRDALGLDRLPLRIECFDISNLGETNAVASMVVFEDGRPKKAHYRKFSVRDVAGQDDFAMMREVVARRFARQRDSDAAGAAAGAHDESFAARPDLVLVDGGKGQLSAAVAAMSASGAEAPVAALAKQREELYVPGRPAPLALPADDPGSLLLQRVRDEAHRFAVTFHRQRRGRDLTAASLFDGLPNVGPVRRRRILEYFGSPERFLDASCDELERVPGLPPRVAREIHARLHKVG